METHTLPYVKQTASGNRPCDTGGSTLRGGTGKKMGGGFRREGWVQVYVCIPVADSR